MALIDEARRRGLIDQIPTGGMRAPAADGSQNNPLNSDLGRNAMNTLAALPGAAGVPGSVARGTGLAARVLGASAPAATAVGQVAQRAAPYAPVAGGAGALYSASSPASPPAPAAISSAAPPGSAAVGQPPRSNPFMDAAMAGPPMSASGSITRDGNSYSGAPNISGDVTFRNPDGSVRQAGGSVTSLPAGASPRGLMEAAGIVPGGGSARAPGYGSPLLQAAGITPGISSQSMGAADGLAARAQAESMGRLMASGQIAAPAAGPSLIMSGNTGFRRDSRFLAQELGAQRALDRAQGRDPASLARAAGLQRTAMEQQGANQRNLWQYALEQQRINQQGEAQGYTNRTNRLVEAARNQVAAEQDPARRRSLVQYMRDIEGRASGPRWKTSVVPGGVDANGQKLPGYGLLTDETTGESRVIQPGQAATQYEAGKVYVNASGARAKWNGSSWEPA